MKTLRLSALLTLFAMALSASAQDRGFFRIHPFTNDTASMNTGVNLNMAETQDGGFVVAISNMGGGLDPAWGRIFRLSEEGDMLHSVPFGDGEGYCGFSIFHHPDSPTSFIGMGVYTTLYQTTPYDQYTSTPWFISFDDNLEITDQHVCEWPDEIQNPIEVSPGYDLSSDGTLFAAFTLFLPSDPIPRYPHRFFAEYSLEGETERFVVDTTTLGLRSRSIEDVFEFPDSGLKGMLHEFTDGPENYQGLYRLSKNYEVSLVNQYHHVYSDTIHNLQPNYWDEYHINLLEAFSTNILALDESTLLIPMIGDELIQRIHLDLNTTFFFRDNTPVLLKTDTEGNVLQVGIVSRMNDTIDAIRRPVALAEPDETGHRCFYLCHYSRDEFYLEYPNNFTVTKYTDDLEVVWRKTFSLPETNMIPHGVVGTADGGCFIAGSVARYIGPYNADINGWFALKLGADGTVATDEITVKDDVFFYPNPVKDVLHLCTPPDVQPRQIELYDMQGRLVRSQGSAFETVDLSQLPTGTYTLRVTMKDGQVFSDKVVKE